MTPYLMESLMTKRGWTLEMINKVIKNCNLAWKTSVGPVQNIRYDDEIDTDEELGPMPCTEDNTGAAVATVTSEMLYVEGGPSVQTGLGARVITMPKRGGGRGTPVAHKNPEIHQGDEVDRERIEEEEGTHGMTQRDQPNRHGHMIRQGSPIMQQIEDIITDQVPSLSGRSDIIRKRPICSLRGCHLPD